MNKKKKLEFSQKLTIGLIIFGMLGVMMSYILAFHEKTNINEAVTIALITQVVGSGMAYMTYQYGLKSNRNKYKLDEDGRPYE